MSSTQENQHWVPKFLIRNFVDTDGRVYCLDVQTDEVTKPPPKRAASKVGFNDFLIDGKLVSFEDELEKIETQAAPILARIVRLGSTAWLNMTQRNRVAKFVAAQSFRTEAFYKGLGVEISREQFGAVFAQLWRSAFLVSEEVKRRRWVAMVVSHEGVFYLGDNPVVLQHAEKPSSCEPLGFDIAGVEMFLPLAPKIALYMPCRTTSEQIVSGYKTALSLHRYVRSATLVGSPLAATLPDPLDLTQRVLRNAHDLYQALTTGVAVPAAPENVENLNYLQCSWAYAAIYSNQRDFAFAKRVFRESPQYRKTPRTRLALVIPAKD
jgi:hypothetical protein